MRVEGLNEKLVAPKGNEVDFGGKPITLGEALYFIVDNDPPRELRQISKEEHINLWRLNKKLAKEPDALGIKSDDITLLLELASLLFNTTLFGIIYDALEVVGPEEEEEVTE